MAASKATVQGIDLEKDQQPANVADAVLACGKRFAVGLENRPVGLQRAAAPSGNVGGIAGKLANCGGCGLCGLRFLAYGNGCRAQFRDSRRGERAAVEEIGICGEYDNTVYLWPDAMAKKGMPPLVLRAVWVHNGKHPMCLLTNVLSKTRLSDQQIVEIYKARWGIELFFRTFKQTFGRRKLRSHSAENAQLELDWSLLGLWAICLFAQRELVRSGEILAN